MFGKRKKLRENLSKNFGTECSDLRKQKTKDKIDLISLFFRERIKSNKPDCVDDITWADLQMNDVFAIVNHTDSFIGEQYLYHRMRMMEKQDEKFEQKVRLLASDEKLCTDIRERLVSIGKSRDENYYLVSLLMGVGEWKINYIWLIHLMQLLLIAVSLGGIITRTKLMFCGLIPIVIVNLLIYLYTKNRFETFLFSIGTLKDIIGMGIFLSGKHRALVLEVSEEISSIIKELRPLSKQIIGWTGRKNAVIYGDLAALMSDYFYGITLLDVSVFNHIMNVINGKQDKILRLFEYIGELELSISVASYRASVNQYCIPKIGNTESIECEDLLHPLLKKPIGNDFHLENRAIITGGNATGKSTFLKALAINIILAKAMNTCIAKCVQLPDLFVMTSMALRDDVISGESYYIREAKRIKEMLDLRGRRSLLIIDEMLKGTNTFERVSASIAILSYFSKTNHFVVVATHDPQLGEKLFSYKKYYFESVITNGTITFDYRIHEGNGGKTNAIALLSFLHYPEVIIEQSEKELKRYSEN